MTATVEMTARTSPHFLLVVVAIACLLSWRAALTCCQSSNALLVSVVLYNDAVCSAPYPTAIYNLDTVYCPSVGLNTCFNSSSTSLRSEPVWSEVAVYCGSTAAVTSLNVQYWTNSAESCNAGVSGINTLHISGGADCFLDSCCMPAMLTRPDSNSSAIDVLTVYGQFLCAPVLVGSSTGIGPPSTANAAAAPTSLRSLTPAFVSLAASLASLLTLVVAQDE